MIGVSTFYRAVASQLSRAARGHKLSILIYHRVLPRKDELIPDAPDGAAFEWQMQVLARYFRVVPLAVAIDELKSGTLKPRTACVTFDDGYADNESVALPILERVGLPATFFVASGFLDGGRMWNDSVIEAIRAARQGPLDLTHCGLGVLSLDGVDSRRRAVEEVIRRIKHRGFAERTALVADIVAAVGRPLPNDLMMTREQVRNLVNRGMEIGAHSVDHPLLATLGDDDARRQIADSRAQLAAIVGRDVRLFAYPNGKPRDDYGKRDVALVRELGFAGAVSTAWGVATAESDFMQLPRFTPWDGTPTRFLWRLLHNYTRTPDTI